MKVYIIVRDSDSKVLGVYKYLPEEIDGCTIFHEVYNGSNNWAGVYTDVFRDGVEDYRTVETPQE